MAFFIMPNPFLITANLRVVAGPSVQEVRQEVQSALRNLKAEINLRLAANSLRQITTLNDRLKKLTANLELVTRGALSATQALNRFSQAAGGVSNVAGRLSAVSKNVDKVAHSFQTSGAFAEEFGRKTKFALVRFASFALPVTTIFGIGAAFVTATKDALDFQNQMVRLAQITNKTQIGIRDTGNEIIKLATNFGVSSAKLSEVAVTLAQAGLSANETKIALEALAKTDVSPTFLSLENTTEAAIALMNQFDVSVNDLGKRLGQISAVSAAYAVESEDLSTAIRKAGGAFKAAGGNFEEFIALFTSVRETTREDADAIATGMRTIFGRLQRPELIKFFQDLGVELTNVKGELIGPFQEIQKISEALNHLKDAPTPARGKIIEELGGLRQLSRVIPLIQQSQKQLEILNLAKRSANQLDQEAVIAQQSLLRQLVSVKEEFGALFKTIASDQTFQSMVKTMLDLARAAIKLTDALSPVLPVIGALAGAKLIRAVPSFIKGFNHKASGGIIPGTGNTDSVPALLTPGEFVIRKSAVQRIGVDNLDKLNRFSRGGRVRDRRGRFISPSILEAGTVDTSIGTEPTTGRQTNARGQYISNQEIARIQEAIQPTDTIIAPETSNSISTNIRPQYRERGRYARPPEPAIATHPPVSPILATSIIGGETPPLPPIHTRSSVVSSRPVVPYPPNYVRPIENALEGFTQTIVSGIGDGFESVTTEVTSGIRAIATKTGRTIFKIGNQFASAATYFQTETAMASTANSGRNRRGHFLSQSQLAAIDQSSSQQTIGGGQPIDTYFGSQGNIVGRNPETGRIVSPLVIAQGGNTGLGAPSAYSISTMQSRIPGRGGYPNFTMVHNPQGDFDREQWLNSNFGVYQPRQRLLPAPEKSNAQMRLERRQADSATRFNAGLQREQDKRALIGNMMGAVVRNADIDESVRMNYDPRVNQAGYFNPPNAVDKSIRRHQERLAKLANTGPNRRYERFAREHEGFATQIVPGYLTAQRWRGEGRHEQNPIFAREIDRRVALQQTVATETNLGALQGPRQMYPVAVPVGFNVNDSLNRRTQEHTQESYDRRVDRLNRLHGDDYSSDPLTQAQRQIERDIPEVAASSQHDRQRRERLRQNVNEHRAFADRLPVSGVTLEQRIDNAINRLGRARADNVAEDIRTRTHRRQNARDLRQEREPVHTSYDRRGRLIARDSRTGRIVSRDSVRRGVRRRRRTLPMYSTSQLNNIQGLATPIVSEGQEVVASGVTQRMRERLNDIVPNQFAERYGGVYRHVPPGQNQSNLPPRQLTVEALSAGHMSSGMIRGILNRRESIEGQLLSYNLRQHRPRANADMDRRTASRLDYLSGMSTPYIPDNPELQAQVAVATNRRLAKRSQLYTENTRMRERRAVEEIMPRERIRQQQRQEAQRVRESQRQESHDIEAARIASLSNRELGLEKQASMTPEQKIRARQRRRLEKARARENKATRQRRLDIRNRLIESNQGVATPIIRGNTALQQVAAQQVKNLTRINYRRGSVSMDTVRGEQYGGVVRSDYYSSGPGGGGPPSGPPRGPGGGGPPGPPNDPPDDGPSKISRRDRFNRYARSTKIGGALNTIGNRISPIGLLTAATVAPMVINTLPMSERNKRGATGGITGALGGATLGSAILPGIGTAIGAIAGAALGAATSIKEFDTELREQKINESLDKLNEAINSKAKPVALNNAFSQVRNTVGGVEGIGILGQGLDFGNVGIYDRAFQNKGNRSFSDSFAYEASNTFYNRLDKQVVDKQRQLAPAQAQAENVLRDFFNKGGTIEGARKSLGSVLDVAGTKEGIFEDAAGMRNAGVKVAHSVLEEVKARKNMIQVITDYTMTLNDDATVLEEMGRAIDNTLAGLERFDEKSKQTTNLFSGQLSGGVTKPIRTVDFGDGRTQFNQGLERLTSGFGIGGATLYRKAQSANDMVDDLPTALKNAYVERSSRYMTGKGVEDFDFGRSVMANMRRGMDSTQSAVLQIRLNQMSEEEIDTAISDPFAAAERLAGDFQKDSEGYINKLQDAIKNFAEFASGQFVQNQQLIQQVGQERDKLSGMQLDRFKLAGEQEAAYTGNTSAALINPDTAIKPFMDMQARLSGGTYLDPTQLSNRIQVLTAARDKAAQLQQSSLDNFDQAGYTAATANFTMLDRQLNDSVEALRNFANATESTAQVQEQLNRINNDSAQRRSIAEGFFGSDLQGRREMLKDIDNAKLAASEGFDSLSIQQQQSAIRGSRTAGNLIVDEESGATLSDKINERLATAMGGAFAQGQGLQNIASDLHARQDAILKLANEAQAQLVDYLASQQEQFATQLAGTLQGALTSFATGMDSALSNMGAKELAQSLNQFANSSAPLVDAMRSFPRTIALGGNHQVNVVMNGQEAMAKIMPDLQKLIQSEIQAGIDQLIKQRFPDSGPMLYGGPTL